MVAKTLESGTLAGELRVRGALSGDANMRIDGDYDGEIDLRGVLQIGPSGEVRGQVRAIDLVIEGTMEGPVELTHALIVKEGGVLKGDARAATVSVEDGAIISGMVDMVFDLAETGDAKESR